MSFFLTIKMKQSVNQIGMNKLCSKLKQLNNLLEGCNFFLKIYNIN